MAKLRLAVIGGGNMGEAMLRGILGANVLAHNEVVCAEPLMERRQQLGLQLNVSTVAAVGDLPPAQCYVLAVKPQKMDAVLPELAERLPQGGALVISIAAGISTAYLAKALGAAARLVRAMPNTPMLVGAGCTGLCKGPGATDDDLRLAGRLFAASGAVHVLDESAIDAVTALSGSGPAYFFYLIEAMVAAGLAEGLGGDVALALAAQTCRGAALLLEKSGEAPEVLRQKVTSPGGTTQAAINTMDAAGVKDSLIQAVRNSARRSRELGR